MSDPRLPLAELHLHLYGTIRAGDFLERLGAREVAWRFYEARFERAYGERPPLRDILEQHRAGDPDAASGKHAVPVPPLADEIDFFITRMLADQRRQGIAYAEQRLMFGPPFTTELARRLSVPILERYAEASRSGLGAHRLGHAIALGVDPEVYGAHQRTESVDERQDQIGCDLAHAEGLRARGGRGRRGLPDLEPAHRRHRRPPTPSGAPLPRAPRAVRRRQRRPGHLRHDGARGARLGRAQGGARAGRGRRPGRARRALAQRSPEWPRSARTARVDCGA